MATRGRKPKPTALKVLSGVRSDRINSNEPINVPGRPDCPRHLCEIAREEWNRIVPILEDSGVLAKTDGTALAIYCAAYARWVRATDAINGKLNPQLGDDQADAASAPIVPKLTDVTAAGTDKVGAFVQIAASAERDMARMLVEFGCTPSSRSRINVFDRKPSHPLAKFKKA